MIELTFVLTIYLYLLVYYRHLQLYLYSRIHSLDSHLQSCNWHKILLHSTAPLQLQRSESVRHDTNPYVADCVICRSSFVYI